MIIDKKSIRRKALELIAEDGRRVGIRLANACGVSRQVASGYLKGLARDGLIVSQGTTRAQVHALKLIAEVSRTFDRAGLDEDIAWREAGAAVVADLPENVRRTWQFAAAEMINNAIDHSGSETVRVSVSRNPMLTEVVVADSGEGIFAKIQRALGLPDPREAILELAKGKLTTAPANHTGEGIFFTSRALDIFEITSHRLRFRHEARGEDALVELAEDLPGTSVRMRLDNASERTLAGLFAQFEDPEDVSFARTVVPLRLAQFGGEALVSRSQARRVATRFERFKRVELDFADVSEIGQGFADEIFRVFAGAHPGIRIVPVNAGPAVDRMIRHVAGASRGEAEQP